MTAAALGTSIELDTLDGDEHLEVRAGTQSGQVVTLRQKGVDAPARARAAATCTCTSRSPRPRSSTTRQEELLRELAAMRGEEASVGTVQAGHPSNSGLFSRLRDAFNS